MREAAGVTIDPSDILAIHLILGAQEKTRPVIAKFKNLEVKIKIIKNRSKKEVKKRRFLRFYHIMQMDSKLLRELKENRSIVHGTTMKKSSDWTKKEVVLSLTY